MLFWDSAFLPSLLLHHSVAYSSTRFMYLVLLFWSTFLPGKKFSGFICFPFSPLVLLRSLVLPLILTTKDYSTFLFLSLGCGILCWLPGFSPGTDHCNIPACAPRMGLHFSAGPPACLHLETLPVPAVTRNISLFVSAAEYHFCWDLLPIRFPACWTDACSVG